MAAAYQLPRCPHIHVDFVLGGYHRSQPLSEVVVIVSDHRRRSLFQPRLRISRPPFRCSPRLFYTSIRTQIHDYCRRHLNLAPCCVDVLLPVLLDTVFTVVNGFHGLPGIIPLEMHIFHRPSSSTHHDLLAEYEREALRESFEGAAAPKPTPASMESILKLVEDNMKTVGDDKEGWSCGNTTCTICLEDMETRRSSLKMPCSHVFHQDCIVGWLKSSHLCPLCRYQMPV